MIRRLNPLYALLPLALFLGACTTDDDESVPPVTDVDPGTGFVATFKPDVALMPFPTDAWRNGSTDGTLNIMEFESDPLILHVQQMNMLDGFGLNSAVWANFSDPIDESTVALGQTAFVFRVQVGGTPVAPTPVMTFDVGTADFQGGRSVVELEPNAPLDPLTTYAVLLTAGIQSSDGTAASADTTFQAMLDAYSGNGADDLEDGSTAEGLYVAMVESLLTLADGAGIGAENVVAAWTFTTQSTSNSLDIVQMTAAATDLVSGFVPVPADPEDPTAGVATAGMLLLPASDTEGDDGIPDTGMNADVYAGVIEMPYYSDPENPLTSYWKPVEASCQTAIDAGLIDEASASTTAFCPQPAVQATIAVPVLVTVPNDHAANAACGGAIAGVTIFQHGITQSRLNILPIAGALAQACHATIAIDLPLHGITDITNGLMASSANPLYAALKGLEALNPGISNAVDALTEQTFNLDVDGEVGIDASGEYFINLESPITARDALRQAAANLIHLTHAIDTIDFDLALAAQGVPGTDVGADFTGLPVRFVGHSLGGITGTVFLGVNSDTTLDAGVLVAAGGDIAELILNSENIYPQVEAGLVEAGLTPGTELFSQFFRNAQTLVEAGDPINYAVTANANHNILMMEVVGDQVVPNSATAKLAEAMGVDVVTTTTPPNPAGVDGLVQFRVGDHGSILSPEASLDATKEMQMQTAVFIGGNPLIPAGPGGTVILITDTSVIAQ